MKKILFWDFQGTLAHNDWMFSKALHTVLINNEPDSKIGIDKFKATPMIGFPWQDHKRDYLHLTKSEDWWKHAEEIFTKCYSSLGLQKEVALQYGKEVRAYFLKGEDFILYDDTLETLKYFKDKGYENIILSNHIPELPEIVEKLGLSLYVSDCLSSANIGYEKPNPKIFHYALEKYNYPEDVWMIGDSITADVMGAKAVGMKGILVRADNTDSVEYYSKDLRGVTKIIT